MKRGDKGTRRQGDTENRGSGDKGTTGLLTTDHRTTGLRTTDHFQPESGMDLKLKAYEGTRVRTYVANAEHPEGTRIPKGYPNPQ